MSRFFPIGKEGAIKAYATQGECEAAEGQACFDIGEDEPGDFDLVDGAAVLNQTKKDERLAAELLAGRVADRVIKIQRGDEVIALISILNEDKGLNASQVQTFVSTYAPIMQMVQSGSFPTAKTMVEAVTPDGVIVTADDKTKIIAKLDELIAYFA